MRHKIRPRVIQLDASSACQLRCPSCPTTDGAIHPTVGTGLLGVENLRALLDANPDLQAIELSNYGEIFLNPALPEILKLCQERNVATTAGNGVNLNSARPEALEAVVRYGMRMLSVSIDGASQESYQKYRVRGQFDTVITNIVRINAHKRRLGAKYPALRWQFVVFGHNEHEIEAARAMAAALGMAFSLKFSWDDDLSPVQDADALRRAMPGNTANRAEFEAKNGTPYAASICNQLWDSPQINWDGKMLGCGRNFWGDFGGNVFTDGLLDTVNNEKMNHARAMLLGKAPARDDIPCTTCDLYKFMQRNGRYLQRASFANGQKLDHDEAEQLARHWHASGDSEKARKMCRSILVADPVHSGALRLLFEIERPVRGEGA